MRRYSTVILVVLLLLPILTIFIFDAKFTSLQHSACAQPHKQGNLTIACDDPVLHERERIVTTAFYRHVGDYFGRGMGTSPSWIDLAVSEDDNYELGGEIGEFNREFAVSLTISIILASISGTLLTQKIIAARTKRGAKE
jgi:hypothetical protein